MNLFIKKKNHYSERGESININFIGQEKRYFEGYNKTANFQNIKKIHHFIY